MENEKTPLYVAFSTQKGGVQNHFYRAGCKLSVLSERV